MTNETSQPLLNEEAHTLFFELADQYHPMTPRDFIEHRGFDGIGGEMMEYVGSSLTRLQKFGSPAFKEMSVVSFMKCVLYILEEMAENWSNWEISDDRDVGDKNNSDLYIIPKKWGI